MHTYTVLISWQIFYLMILTIRCMSKGKLSATQRVSEFFYEWIAMEAHKIHNYKQFSHSRFRMEFKMLIQIKKNSIAIFFMFFFCWMRCVLLAWVHCHIIAAITNFSVSLEYIVVVVDFMQLIVRFWYFAYIFKLI